MSSEEREPTHLPSDKAIFQPLGYLLCITFQPEIKLVRSKGLAFGAKLATEVAGFEPETTQLADTHWLFEQRIGATADGVFRVAVSQTEITIEAGSTGNRLQWFEDRSGVILQSFRSVFSPMVVVSTTARINGTLEIDGDARIFLTRNVTHFDGRRLRVFERPVQLFGLRFSMPAYKRRDTGEGEQPGEVVDWHIEARAESLMTDPRQLFLETVTVWQRAFQWDDDTVGTEIERLRQADDFLQKKLITCLKDTPDQGDN